jgi:GNAT superfamily N-acetyltransferase
MLNSFSLEQGMTGRIRAALDHGVFLLRLNGRFSRLTGIELDVFYLVREGEFRGEPEWQTSYPDFKPVLLSREDLELIAPDYSGNDIAGLRSRYDRGHICVGLKHEDSFAAVTWADLKECNYESLHFAMAENEAYLYDAFTLPEYRGKGLAPYMRYQCYEQLKAMGRDRFYSVSAYLNKPAIRFKQKLNARFEKLYVSIATKSGKSHTWKVKTY